MSTPIKAIREKCKDCMCGQINEIKLCPITECSLFSYRLGTNPNIKKRDYTDEQRKTMGERLQQNLARNADCSVGS